MNVTKNKNALIAFIMVEIMGLSFVTAMLNMPWVTVTLVVINSVFVVYNLWDIVKQ